MVGLTSLVIKDLGNILQRSSQYMNEYGDQIEIKYDSGATVNITKDKYIMIEFSRKENDTTCGVNLYVTFPTNVLVLAEFLISSDGRNFGILNDASSNEGTISDSKIAILTFSANTKYTLISTCGIYNSKSGVFVSKIWIYVLDWW